MQGGTSSNPWQNTQNYNVSLGEFEAYSADLGGVQAFLQFKGIEIQTSTAEKRPVQLPQMSQVISQLQSLRKLKTESQQREAFKNYADFLLQSRVKNRVQTCEALVEGLRAICTNEQIVSHLSSVRRNSNENVVLRINRCDQDDLVAFLQESAVFVQNIEFQIVLISQQIQTIEQSSEAQLRGELMESRFRLQSVKEKLRKTSEILQMQKCYLRE